jgi:hypothetical protein
VLPTAPEGDEISGLKKRYPCPCVVALNERQFYDNLLSRTSLTLKKISHLGISDYFGQ